MRLRSLAASTVIAASLLLPATASAQSSVVEDVNVRQETPGPVYEVEPALSGGRVGSSALSSDPSAELEANGIPATQSIVNQLLCHVIFVPFKETWNLESYRPVVSPIEYVFSLCNP